jgi:hypothetical protein
MIHLSEINFNKSVEQGWLYYNQGRWFRFRRTLGVIYYAISMSGIIICLLFLAFKEADFNNPNDKFLSIIGLILIPLFIYSIYRKIFENKLLRISTQMPAHITIIKLRDFLQKRAYEEIHGNDHCLVAKDPDTFAISDLYYKQIVILVTDSTVFVNIRRHNPRENLPVLFLHYFLKAGVRKAIRQAEASTL